MVINNNTLELLHKPTNEGQDYYNNFLEYKADLILLKHNHPLKFIWLNLKEKINDLKNRK